MFNLGQPTNVVGGMQNWLGAAGNWLSDRAADVATGLGWIKRVDNSSPTTTTPKTTTPTSTSTANNDWARESAALQKQLQALQNQLSQQPRLPNFDIMANYNKAKKTATSAVTPLYNKKLDIFLQGQGIKRDTKTSQRDLALENSAIAERSALEDNQTSRVRTGEDLTAALQQIEYNRGNYLQDDALAFDDARRALQEDVAAGGSTDTGLGQQQIGRQQDDRNTASERQLTAFQNDEAAKNLLANRTLADLATSDTRAGERRTQEDKGTQLDFDSYMRNLANEETSFRLTNDLERALAIAEQTRTYQQQGVQQFLASLAGQGWRAQDIALATQVYGR